MKAILTAAFLMTMSMTAHAQTASCRDLPTTANEHCRTNFYTYEYHMRSCVGYDGMTAPMCEHEWRRHLRLEAAGRAHAKPGID